MNVRSFSLLGIVGGLALLLVLGGGVAPEGLTEIARAEGDIDTPITLGQPYTVNITTSGQNAYLRFSGNTGQRIAIQGINATSGFQATYKLIAPDGLELASKLGIGNVFVDSSALHTKGTYTIFIDPSGSTTGSITITAFDVPADFTSSITIGGATVTATTTTPGQDAFLTFSGTQGQRVSIQGTNASAGLQATVALVSPDGAEVASQLILGNFFMDLKALPLTGNYKLLIDPYQDKTGSVTIKVNSVPADFTSSITIGGATVTATTTTPGQDAFLTFSGTAGQRISIQGTNATAGFTHTPRLISPDGATVASLTAIGNFFMDLVALPLTGSYTLLIDGYQDKTGSVTIKVNSVPADFTSSITIGGATVTATTTTPGQDAFLTFTGDTGQRISIQGTNATTGFQASYRVVAPDGATITSYGPVAGNFFIDLVALPQTGNYKLLIDPYQDKTGGITIKINSVPADFTSSITIGGATVTATTTTPGQDAFLTFSGTAGQRISIQGTNATTGFTAYYKLTAPDGAIVISPTLKSGNFTLSTVALPFDGSYTLTIDPYQDKTGSITIGISLVDTTTVNQTRNVEAQLVLGTPLTVGNTVSGQNIAVRFTGNAGQRISLKGANSTFSTCPSLSLSGPNGKSVTITSASIPCFFVEPVILPAGGTYTLLIDPSSTQIGNIDVTGYDVPSSGPTPLTLGTASTVTTTTPGHNVAFSFTGTAGQRVSFYGTGNTYTDCPKVQLVGPNGKTVVDTNTLCIVVELVVLTAAGTYVLVVDPNYGQTGTVQVTGYDVPSSGPTPLTLGTASTVTTTILGHNVTFSFTGTAGQRVSFYGTGSTYSTCPQLSLLGPNGKTVVNTPFLCILVEPVILPAGGTYTVIIDPQYAETGTVQVTGYDMPSNVTATLSFGATSTVTTTIPGQNATLSFAGSAGQRVSFNGSNNTYSDCPQLTLLGPNAKTLVNTPFLCLIGVGPLTLPISGTYTAIIDGKYAQTGSVQVSLSLVVRSEEHMALP